MQVTGRLGLGLAAALAMALGACGGSSEQDTGAAGGAAGGETETSGASGVSGSSSGEAGRQEGSGAAGSAASDGGRSPAGGSSGSEPGTGGESVGGESGGSGPDGGSAGSAGTSEPSGGTGGHAGEDASGGSSALAGTGGDGAAGTGGDGAAGIAGSSGAPSHPWAGVWDGVSVNTSDANSAPLHLMALIDMQDRVFVADTRRNVHGWGTINASGEVVFAVDGELTGDFDEPVEYSGRLEGDAGEGQWVQPPDSAGTWTATRRAGIDVDTACAASCDLAAPCMGPPDDEPERSIGNCAFVCALPSPAEVIMMDRVAACAQAATCEALNECYVAGTLDTAYVSPAGDDANDGAAPARPKLTLNAAIADLAVDGTIRIAAGTFAENVVVTKPLTLVGGYDSSFATLDPIANPVILDGDGADRVVSVFTPPAGSNRLVLQGVSLVNGHTSSSGGGIAAYGLGEVALEDCNFTDNVAEVDGGGMAAADVDLTITGCRFDSNLAGGNAGGGLSVSRSLITLLDSSFTNNQAANYGGGMDLYESQSTITGCEVTGNTASVNGGGIHFSNATVGDHSLGNSVVTGNSPNDVSGTFEDAGGNTIGGA